MSLTPGPSALVPLKAPCLPPLLFSLFTNSYTSSHQSVKLLKFADDTTHIVLISGGEEPSSTYSHHRV